MDDLLYSCELKIFFHRDFCKCGIVDVMWDSQTAAVFRHFQLIFQSFEEYRICFRIMKRLAFSVQCRDSQLGNEHGEWSGSTIEFARNSGRNFLIFFR